MIFRTVFLASLLLTCTTYADSSPEPDDLNTDGSGFKAPRLAGDSLPIAGFKRDSNSNEVNNITDAFSKGKVKGLIRYSAQHRDSNLHLSQDSNIQGDPNSKKQQYSAIGGYLGYETAPWFHTSVGATFYTAHGLGNNPNERGGLGGLNDSGPDGTQQESYTVLGEAFVKFKTDQHRIVYGRQEMPNYRFISLSNIRMSPFTHEGTTYENTVIKDLQLNFAYITKQKDRNSEKFEDMVRSARVKQSSNGKQLVRGSSWKASDFEGGTGGYIGDNKQMPMFGAVYKPGNMTLEAWDYYVDDFINTVYLYGDYSFNPTQDLTLTAAFQYASQNDVGDSLAGDVNSWFYGLKAQASLASGMTFFAAYNEVKYDEGSYDGGTIFVRWGTPQMFNSFQVQDSELAGTKSYGVGAQFELGKMGIVPNTVIRFRYADYNMPDNFNQTDARLDRTEATFDLRYSFTKNDGFGIFTQMEGLSVQFRIAYDNFESISTETLDAYALAHGYSIPNVTKDFVDTRLYIDYVF